MRLYGYKRRKRQKVALLLAFLISSLVIFAIIISNWLENMLIDAFEDKAKLKIVEITNTSILQVLQEQKVDYDDIVKFEKSKDTSFIKIDTIYLNKIISNWVLMINKRINKLTPVEVEFKLGYLLKNIFFNQFGPTLKGNVLYVSAVSYDWQSEFNSAGINQTVHRIYLNLNFEGHMLFLKKKGTFKIPQRILIAENVYIGEVPKVYIGK